MSDVLIFGESGQMAQELRHIWPEARFLGRSRVDLRDSAAVSGTILERSPRIVVNAAAYTAVDRAETEPDNAYAINADAPGEMARACAETGSVLVHVSTDYVFDGSGTQPWRPEDATGPLGVYGASKLAGEQAVRESGAKAAILRTSWVFSAHGTNFMKTMLRLGVERDQLRIVADQYGGPTPADALAHAARDVAEALADGAPGGVYHFAGSPDVSWAGFARAIFAHAGLSCMVEEIPTSDYPTPAARPLNSRLDCTSLTRDFAIERPDWNKGILDALAKLEIAH